MSRVGKGLCRYFTPAARCAYWVYWTAVRYAEWDYTVIAIGWPVILFVVVVFDIMGIILKR